MPPLTAATRCAPLSLARGDQRFGTAVPVTRWLLVELPGPWGRDAVLSSRLAPQLAQALTARCREAGVRPMLIRRVGRSSPAGHRQSSPAGHRRWAYADSRLGTESIGWGEYADDHELLEIPLDGRAGQRSAAPAYLVCTHARHDACCAIRGRPVAAALAALRPDEVWECSHTGGDRFAANVVVLPHGLYYGNVPPERAAELVAVHETGRVVPDLLRGRSALPMAVQAAQHFAREATADLGVDALAPVEVDHLDAASWRVRFDCASDDIVVTVRARVTEAVPRLTCAAPGLQRMTTFDMIDVERI